VLKNEGMTIKIDARNLDCVKNTIRVINNCIVEECGIISEYNEELLIAMLGDNWNEEYCIGREFMEVKNDN